MATSANALGVFGVQGATDFANSALMASGQAAAVTLNALAAPASIPGAIENVQKGEDAHLRRRAARLLEANTKDGGVREIAGSTKRFQAAQEDRRNWRSNQSYLSIGFALMSFIAAFGSAGVSGFFSILSLIATSRRLKDTVDEPGLEAGASDTKNKAAEFLLSRIGDGSADALEVQNFLVRLGLTTITDIQVKEKGEYYQYILNELKPHMARSFDSEELPLEMREAIERQHLDESDDDIYDEILHENPGTEGNPLKESPKMAANRTRQNEITELRNRNRIYPFDPRLSIGFDRDIQQEQIQPQLPMVEESAAQASPRPRLTIAALHTVEENLRALEDDQKSTGSSHDVIDHGSNFSSE